MEHVLCFSSRHGPGFPPLPSQIMLIIYIAEVTAMQECLSHVPLTNEDESTSILTSNAFSHLLYFLRNISCLAMAKVCDIFGECSVGCGSESYQTLNGSVGEVEAPKAFGIAVRRMVVRSQCYLRSWSM